MPLSVSASIDFTWFSHKQPVYHSSPLYLHVDTDTASLVVLLQTHINRQKTVPTNYVAVKISIEHLFPTPDRSALAHPLSPPPQSTFLQYDWPLIVYIWTEDKRSVPKELICVIFKVFIFLLQTVCMIL